MAMFRYSEVRKGVLVPRGAETHEVVASDPRIDGVRAILVHFGRFWAIWGILGIPREVGLRVVWGPL